MVRTINNYILVKNIPHDPKGKIFLPPEFRKKLKIIQRGTVISAGEGSPLLPMPVKAGNEVVYDKAAGFDVDLKGETFRVLSNFNIICAK
jgi:co-chaperonin GroES (HSP10)